MANPRQDGKPVAIVLGGVSPHIAVIARLKALGFHTVLFDYKPAPPAAAHADRHVQVSTLDTDAVLAEARALGPQAIVNVCLDQPLPVLAEVRAALGLPGPLTPEAAHLLTSKDAMKAVLLGAGIDTARWTVARDRAGLDLGGLSYPVVAKPVGGTGSLGVVFARDRDRLEAALDASFAHAGPAGVLVEEFIEGTELSIDCMVTGGEVHVLLARERHKTWTPDGLEATCHGTVAPADLPGALQVAMEAQARAIARAFGVTDGPLLIQAIRDPGDRLVVLEVAGRIGGGPGASRVVELSTGFGYVAASIDQQLGRPVRVTRHDDDGVYGAANIYAGEGVFHEIRGMDAACRDGLISEYYVYRTPGERIGPRISGRSRVTAFAIRGRDRADLKARMQAVMDRVEITDPEGRSILRRDIGLHLSL